MTGFNLTKSIPLIIECGHTLCKDCLTRMKKGPKIRCPFDNIWHDFHKIDDFPINFALKDLIENEKVLFEKE